MATVTINTLNKVLNSNGKKAAINTLLYNGFGSFDSTSSTTTTETTTTTTTTTKYYMSSGIGNHSYLALVPCNVVDSSLSPYSDTKASFSTTKYFTLYLLGTVPAETITINFFKSLGYVKASYKSCGLSVTCTRLTFKDANGDTITTALTNSNSVTTGLSNKQHYSDGTLNYYYDYLITSFTFSSSYTTNIWQPIMMFTLNKECPPTQCLLTTSGVSLNNSDFYNDPDASYNSGPLFANNIAAYPATYSDNGELSNNLFKVAYAISQEINDTNSYSYNYSDILMNDTFTISGKNTTDSKLYIYYLSYLVTSPQGTNYVGNRTMENCLGFDTRPYLKLLCSVDAGETISTSYSNSECYFTCDDSSDTSSSGRIYIKTSSKSKYTLYNYIYVSTKTYSCYEQGLSYYLFNNRNVFGKYNYWVTSTNDSLPDINGILLDLPETTIDGSEITGTVNIYNNTKTKTTTSTSTSTKTTTKTTTVNTTVTDATVNTLKYITS